MGRLAAAVAVAASLCGSAAAKKAVTDLAAAEYPWAYLTDFVFETSNRSKLERYNIRARPSASDWGMAWWTSAATPRSVKVVIYDDEYWSWAKAREALLSPGNVSDTCAYLTTRRADGGPAVDVMPGGGVCTAASPCFRPIIQYARRRYWYVLAVDCTAGLAGTVATDMTNPGGFFRHEFSVDRTWMLEFYSVAAVLQAALLTAFVAAGRREPVGAVVGAFLASAFLQTAASVCAWLHYFQFAHDGVGSVSMLEVSELLSIVAGVVLMGLLVVFASAFTLAPQEGERGGRSSLRRQRLVLHVTFSTLLAVHLIVFVVRLSAGRSNLTASYAYPYDAASGEVLAALRVPIAAYFVATLARTVRLVPEFKKHFVPIGAFFLLYILSLPLLIVAANAVSPWVRYRWIEIPAVALVLAAQGAMGVTLWPGAMREIALQRSKRVPFECEDGNLRRLSGGDDEGLLSPHPGCQDDPPPITLASTQEVVI
eukprot:TRINITY_DN7773_c2_g1_i4.p1 TRINITY_DN7773_c2_g1~~TRINITY_DN7773_c2_g1_i4.p1  ORF type:complete len:508 (+),score=162.68 TRINITY_DN7773_c2_g1_i4:78-1526(+)